MSSEQTKQQMKKAQIDAARYATWIDDPTTQEVIGVVEGYLKQAQDLLESPALVDRDKLAEVRATILVFKTFADGPVKALEELGGRIVKMKDALAFQMEEEAPTTRRIS